MIYIRQHEANHLREQKQEIVVYKNKNYLVDRGNALALLDEYRNSIKVK
jgi:hypothetical protein